MKHIFDQSILRQYDIRGLVGKTLREGDFYFVGRSFGTIMVEYGLKTVAVGFDGRESSPKFADALIKGLNECGIDVENVGLGPSPYVYFAVKHRGLDASVVITGSHSPLEFNGIKMALATRPFYGEDVQRIGTIAASGKFAQGSGKHIEIDLQDVYVERLLKDYNHKRELTVAWDNGNGAAGEIIRRLTKKLPGKHILLFDKIDGTFPNHHPDPAVAKNLVDLQKTVIANKCDIGVAFDGDADRFGAIDENAEIIWADILVALYAENVLKEKPNSFVLGDVKCSRVLFDAIEKAGGKPYMSATGHSILKAKMQELNAPLAGELSGHICFADKYYGFDDGLYCAIRMLDILSNSQQKLSELVAHFPKMLATPEVRHHVEASRKFVIPTEIKARLQKSAESGVSVSDVDGVRVTSKEGWWLIRASNTEDLLTIRAESFDAAGLEKLKGEIIQQLLLSGVGDAKDIFK